MAMRIGALASAAGCSVETVRYYEREGLLRIATRSDGNYRLYGDDALKRLRFIRRCRSLDMAHDEIRTLLRSLDAPQEPCTEVNLLLDAHIGHVEQRIAELNALHCDLVGLRSQCAAVRDAQDCGIVQALVTTVAAPQVDPSSHVHRTHGRE